MSRTRALALLTALAGLAYAGAPLAAHEIAVDYRLEGRQLVVEAYYPPDAPAADATVRVEGGGRDLAIGTTDAEGRFRCVLPEGVDRARVTVRDAGHEHAVVVVLGQDAARAKRGWAWQLGRIVLGVFLIIGVFALLRATLRASTKRRRPNPHRDTEYTPSD